MGSVDRMDDRTFKISFTGEGAAKLRNTVEEKLKEFMGDYTDETLVEYVIVLLRNGRNKEEARNELDVFLGDDSDSFVSWLWDHLASSLYLYIPAKEPDVAELMPILELDGRNNSLNIDVDSERDRSSNLSRSHHNREQKGPAGDAAEPPPILKSEVEEFNGEEKDNRQVDRAKRIGSPRRPVQKKRTRADEHPQVKELEYKAVEAPRRLLQFAVRDAVRMPRSDSATDSASKRLRSVVSTLVSDIPQADRSQRRVSNSMSTVIRAVSESAEDTRRTKAPGSVFDRLSRGAEVMEPKFPVHWEAAGDDEDYAEFNNTPLGTHPTYAKQYSHGDRTNMERELELLSGYPSASNNYGEVSVRRRHIISQITAVAGTRGGDSSMMQHNVANKSVEATVEQNKDELPVAANKSRRTVNNNSGASTSKPTFQYRAQTEHAALHRQKPLHSSTVAATKLNTHDVKENYGPVTVANGNGNPAAESLKPQSSSGLPIHVEDAELRTIFVNNVHTAATVGSLSHHFSKCGEVVKVVISTDATTGQPIGSAVIEFTGKAAADNALSLDGTSFMSRVIKVVKWRPGGGVHKSGGASQSHADAVGVRSSGTIPYAAWYPPRSPFARGGGVYRGGGRGGGGGGARSFQWKREDRTPASSSSANSTTPLPPFPASRRFTYVRTGTKPNAS